MSWGVPAGLAALAVLLIAAETLAQARRLALPRRRRWATNLGLWLVGGGVLMVAARLFPAGAAGVAAEAGFGLLSFVSGPDWAEAAAAFLLLDLAIYAQHRAYHLPGLWRLHAAHHADPELDVSSGLRFHPFELAASAAWKAATLALVGAPVWVALVYEAAQSAMSLFTHANLAFPKPIERALGWMIITPAAHRLHHDRAAEAAAPNFGATLSLWDRLFGSWRRADAEPAALGLAAFGDRGARLATTLASPFHGERRA